MAEQRTPEDAHRICDLIDDARLTRRALALARKQQGLITVSQLSEYGVADSTASRRTRAGSWNLAAPHVVDLARAPLRSRHPRERELRATYLGLLSLGPDAVAVGYSALALYGVHGIPLGHEPEVALTSSSHLRSRGGIRVRRLAVSTVVVVKGWRAEGILTALAHAALRGGPQVALGLLDSAIHQGLIGYADLPRIRRLTRGRRGCRALEPMWDLVDGRRESPLESWAYWVLWRDGFEPTDIQVEIVGDHGQLIARGDIGFETGPGQWLLLDMHGAEFHNAWAAVKRDAQRLNRLVGRSRVLTAFADDLSGRQLADLVGEGLGGNDYSPPRAGVGRRLPRARSHPTSTPN